MPTVAESDSGRYRPEIDTNLLQPPGAFSHARRVGGCVGLRGVGQRPALSLPPAAWLAQARCIHVHEGPWNANTGNGHFGGMQFSAQTWLRMNGHAAACVQPSRRSCVPVHGGAPSEQLSSRVAPLAARRPELALVGRGPAPPAARPSATWKTTSSLLRTSTDPTTPGFQEKTTNRQLDREGPSSINGANTGFMLLAASLVMLMTPGLAFFYGGLVGRKNILTIMIQSFVSMGMTTVLWCSSATRCASAATRAA